jgi:hypothetical protein
VQRELASVELWESAMQSSNLNAVAEPVRKTVVLSQAWAILPGLTLPGGGIRSIDGHDY